MRHPFTAQGKDLARLSSGRNIQFCFAFGCEHFNLGAQGSLRHINVQVEQDIILVAAKIFVWFDLDFDIQVPVWPAVCAGLGFICQTNLSSVVDAGWN